MLKLFSSCCFVCKTVFINILNGSLYNFDGFYLYIMDLNQFNKSLHMLLLSRQNSLFRYFEILKRNEGSS